MSCEIKTLYSHKDRILISWYNNLMVDEGITRKIDGIGHTSESNVTVIFPVINTKDWRVEQLATF